MKTTPKKVIILPIALCLILCLTNCAVGKDLKFELEHPNGTTEEYVNMHTPRQSKYLQANYTDIALYADGKEEASHPLPISLKWSATENGKTLRKAKYTVEISKNASFEESFVYNAETNGIDVYNLEIGTKYYWRVGAETAIGKQTSESTCFTTADAAPRNLFIDGVTNARDLGGWITESGGRVRQGMIYRCGRLNKSETSKPEIEITETGISIMREQLKIVTEIDLRMPDAHNIETGGITSSPLGDDITYRNIAMDWLQNGEPDYLSNEEYYPAIREFFTTLADEKNYPLIFHCNIGTDRTGLFAYLINGLLGVSNADLYRDYLFSNFANIGGSRSLKNMSYVDRAMSFDGNSVSEKIENCLLHIGVGKAEIDALRNIMLRKSDT